MGQSCGLKSLLWLRRSRERTESEDPDNAPSIYVRCTGQRSCYRNQAVVQRKKEENRKNPRIPGRIFGKGEKN